jgi:putative restriction endonuclease
VKAYIGITDEDWYSFLAARASMIDEVNFWQPSGNRVFRALSPGDLFLFKLHQPHHFIVGGALFAHFSILPVSLAWDAFGEKNGASSLEEIRSRIGRYRRVSDDPMEDYRIGCILLEQPFFFSEADWVKAPSDWGMQTVQGATYDLGKGEGKRVWQEVVARAPLAAVGAMADPLPLAVSEPRFGKPTVVFPRLGQGTFRVLVTDVYDRRCAVTGERTLPVLEAAHIRPYGLEGPHDPRNGLLLRSDLHTLFDRGYVTVTPERRFEVSGRIRDEFDNGRDYHSLQGREVRAPNRPDAAPSLDYLQWHASNVFKG